MTNKLNARVLAAIAVIVAAAALLFVGHTRVADAAPGGLLVENYWPYAQYNDGIKSENGIVLSGADGDITTGDDLTVADALATVDITVSDDLVVTDDATITSDLFVDGTLTADAFLNEVATLIASTTLTAADSGKTIYAGTENVQVTLPSPAAGLNFRMVVSANFANTNMLLQGPASSAADDVIFGTLEVAGAAVLCAAEDTISFVNTAELPGDWVAVHSDGTNWYVSGQGGTSGAITCTDAD